MLTFGSVPLLLLGLAGAANAAPPPTPPPRPHLELPGGPWPPDELLAADPDTVTAPALAVAAPATPCPAAPYGVRSTAPGTGKTVALTFDDGPGVTTAAILSILQRYGVPATFFNLGLNSTVRPELVRSEAVAGHVLANHSWDHPRMPTLTAAEQASQMDRATNEQIVLTAVAPCLFRPPYGEYNATTLSLAQQRGMAVWNWSVDPEDWKSGTSTSPAEADRVYSGAIAGGSQQHPVILLHNPPAGIPATVTALPRIIEYYRAHAYVFVDLLGGQGRRATAPAAAATGAGMNEFVRTSAGDVARRTLLGATWSGFTSLGGQVINGPAAAAISTTTAAVVAIGTNNAVFRRTAVDGSTAGSWLSLGQLATSRPAVAISPGGVESVVIRAANGQVVLRERTGTQWGAWQSLGGLLAPYAPAVAVTAGGVLTVAGVGTDKAMWVRNRSAAGAWSGWRKVGGLTDNDVALSTTADGARLVAVVRGLNQGAYVTVGNATATSWTGWTSIGGIAASAPAAAVNGSALNVFVVGTDGRHFVNTATNGTMVTGWTGWRQVA